MGHFRGIIRRTCCSIPFYRECCQAQHRIYVRLNTEYTSGSTQNIRQAQHRIYVRLNTEYTVEPRSPMGQKKVSLLVRCPHFRGWNGCKSGTNWGVLFKYVSSVQECPHREWFHCIDTYFQSYVCCGIGRCP